MPNKSRQPYAGRRLRLLRSPALKLVAQDKAKSQDAVPLDPYRHVVFPNRIREQRLHRGMPRLLPFATTIPQIPYIRMSKIERGEVFARADELVRIAGGLGLAPADLLIDVDSPDFDIAAWFEPFAEGAAADDAEEARFAVLLAAAVRDLRAANPGLTATRLDNEYGIAPVILSRIENAQKGLSRWNQDIVDSLCRLFDVPDEAALRASIHDTHALGALDPALATVPGPNHRIERTRQRIATLANELENPPAITVTQAPADTASRLRATVRQIPLHGVPAADGAIAMLPTGETVEAPADAGPRAFGVRVSRATLGPGLPGNATVVVDPDRYPRAGGLALLRQGDVHRLVAVLGDRTGALIGYTLNPEREIPIDGLDPADIATVIAAYFV